MSGDVPQEAAAWLMAATLAGNAPSGHLLEVRCLDREFRPGPREWFPVGAYREAAAFALGHAGTHNSYLSALPRTRRAGGKADVAATWALWAEIDRPDAVARFMAFPVRPSILIETGTPGHALGIWQLSEPIAATGVMRENRRLGRALGGDLAATDEARVLRLPATFNHKTDPPRPVVCVAIEPYSYRVVDIVGDLPEVAAPPRPPRRRTSTPPMTRDDVLREIPASEYVPALTGLEVGGDSKVRCPFHGGGQERTPSLHVWDDPEHGWFCFACERGGTIIDFGAELYRIEPRGTGFQEIRRQLAADLLKRLVA